MGRLQLALIAALTLVFTSAEARGHGGGHYGFSSHSHAYSAEHYTRGYTRRNGTYVHGYHATNPNSTRNDNFSTRGNVNPYSGEPGTKPRDRE